MSKTINDFPDFDLKRLLNTVFKPKKGEKLCILIDLDNLDEFKDFKFLENTELSIQKNAVEYFYKPLNEYLLSELELKGGEIFAYKRTGGSNLDLPEQAYKIDGTQIEFKKDIYPEYDIILCISTDSATAPLTTFCKEYNFRGSTMHGLNDIILQSGLSVDYNEVSKEAEKIRLGMTNADWVEIDFEFNGQKETVKLNLDQQDAQKSHGLCDGDADIANLPAGEVYFVPTSAYGKFPFKLENNTLALLELGGKGVIGGELISGDQSQLDQILEKFKSDPASGWIGELGFGTQELPVSGHDIQDEKIRGTVHIATGRDDHLGGHISPEDFKNKQNATHDDILFSPEKTPEVNIPEVRMHKNGETIVLMQNYKPSSFIEGLLAG